MYWPKILVTKNQYPGLVYIMQQSQQDATYYLNMLLYRCLLKPSKVNLFLFVKYDELIVQDKF